MITLVHDGPPRHRRLGICRELAQRRALQGGLLHLIFPSGRYGHGEAFTVPHKRDFGGGDPFNILASIEAVEWLARSTTHALGLGGCRYCGFMAMSANTHTDRFKGTIAEAGVSNWVSY